MKRSLAVLAAAALVHAPAAAGWSWPVDGPVIRPFVFGDDPYAGGQHRGIDVGAPAETPVHAASAGTVWFAGTVPSGGRTVTVRTRAGLSVTYSELGAIRVARGAEVVEGDPIGTVGPAGHVHLGVRVTADPHGYLDPLGFLPARVEAPARADPVETASPKAAQPDPVVEPSPAQAAAPEPDGPPPPATEPTGSPPGATEPAVTRPDSIARNSAADELAESPSDAGVVTAGVGETQVAAAKAAKPVATRRARAPAGAAERVGTRHADVSADASEPTAPRRAVAHTSATPAPRRGRAKATRSAENPSRSVAAPPVSAPAPANEVTGPAAAASGGPSVPAARPVRQARLSEPQALRRGRGEPERGGEESGSARLELMLGLLAVAVLGAAIAATTAVRRRRPSVLPEGASPDVARRVESESCPVGRLRAPHVIHACARAREPGWVLPGTPRRGPAPRQRVQPLPRPRRRALAGTRS